jgi:DNA-binding winged helix-turn-helix (wHTH) protein
MNSSEFPLTGRSQGTSGRATYEFGAFRLDAARRQVVSSADGQPLELKPRAFDTLLFFVEHAGQLLDKATLMQAIWPNAVVEENNLNQHVFALRRALAQTDARAQYIATVSRRGYQFVMPVRATTANERTEPAQAAEGAPPRSMVDPQACQLYLQARALSARPTDQNLRSAISLFREATARDPRFAQAFSGSASAHMGLVGMAFEFDALVTVGQEARQALAIDPNLAEAHALLGCTAAYRGKLIEAHSHFAAALSLDPSDPGIRTWCTASVTAPAGHMRQALQEQLETYRLSPAHPATLIVMAFLHLNFARDAEALKYADLAAGLGFAGYALPIPFIRAQVAQRRGRYEEAAGHVLGMFASVAGSAEIKAMIELIYAAFAGSARRDAAAAAIRRIALSAEVTLLNPVRFARPLLLWSTLLGDLDLAYDIANAVLEDFRSSGIIRVSAGFVAQMWMPEMLAFRQDPRLQPFLAALGLVEYWGKHGPPDNCELRDGRLRCR